MKAVVAAFNQEKALVGAFSVITNLRMQLFGALITTAENAGDHDGGGAEAGRDLGPPGGGQRGRAVPGDRAAGHGEGPRPGHAPQLQQTPLQVVLDVTLKH